MTKVTLTWDAPTTRADGITPLAISEITQFNIFRNGAGVAVVKPPFIVAGQNSYVDTETANGTDTFDVTTSTSDGLVSVASNSVVITITIATPTPAAAIVDLAAAVTA